MSSLVLEVSDNVADLITDDSVNEDGGFSLDFQDITTPITLKLGEIAGDESADDPGDDIILTGSGSDNVSLGEGDDVLLAGAGNDLVFGGEGSDFLRGDAGNDFIRGGAGADFIIGGAGNDFYDLRGQDYEDGSVDVYLDFEDGEAGTNQRIDTLRITGASSDVTYDAGTGYVKDGDQIIANIGAGLDDINVDDLGDGTWDLY